MLQTQAVISRFMLSLGDMLCWGSLENPSFSDSAGVCFAVGGTVKGLQLQDRLGGGGGRGSKG